MYNNAHREIYYSIPSLFDELIFMHPKANYSTKLFCKNLKYFSNSTIIGNFGFEKKKKKGDTLERTYYFTWHHFSPTNAE